MKKYIVILLLALIPSSAGSWGVVPMSAGSGADPTNLGDLSADENCQASWSFEGGLTDSSGKGNTLTKILGTETYGTTYLIKSGTQSLTLNGSTIFIRTGTSGYGASMPGYATATAITVGGWFRTSSIGSLMCPFAFCIPGTANSWSINILATGKPQFQMYTAALAQVSVDGATTLQANTNYFIVGTWSSNELRVYLGTDSNLVAEDDAAHVDCASMYYSTSSTTEITIGGYYNFGLTLTGYQEDLGVFNRLLSLDEMKSWQLHGLNGAR
jgi:hypothetical protein